MGKIESTKQTDRKKARVQIEKARKVENSRRSNKNKSTSHNVRGVEERKAKIKGIKKVTEQRMWIKKMRFQTAPYIEKQHVTQRREKQQMTGEKKGKRVDFWSNQCGTIW